MTKHDHEFTAFSSNEAKEGLQLVTPVPAEFTKSPDLRGSGRLVATYDYKNGQAALVMKIARYECENNKALLPYTVWRNAQGVLDWRCKNLPENRPLYRLPDLVAAPDLPVLLVEGEKCADAAAEFAGFTCVTWAGGTNALTLTDFSPLQGRDVLILPDNDAPGMKAAGELGSILAEVGAKRVQQLDIVGLARQLGRDAEPAFDIADAIELGLTGAAFAAMLEERPDLVSSIPHTTSESAEEPAHPLFAELWRQFGQVPDIPDGFDLTRDGLIKVLPGRGDRETLVFAGSPIAVLGRTRSDAGGEGWGYLVAVRTPTAAWETQVLPARLLAGDGREMRETLADLGFVCPQDRAGRQALAEYVGYAASGQIVDVASRPGWLNDAFVLPQEVIQPAAPERRALIDMGGRQHHFAVGGEREVWRELAGMAQNNSRAAFAICVALAAPLLRPLNESGNGFHLYGRSSRGKTTLLTLAGSVWGGGGRDGFVRAWRMTMNGVEAILSDHNDVLLPLDELTLTSPENVREAAYLLANGQGKVRSRRDGSARPTAQWRTLVLSSGENTAANQIRSGRGRSTGGMSVRLIDVPVEYQSGSTFEDISGFADEGEFATTLNAVARCNYGYAGPEFVRHLVAETDLRGRAGGFMREAQDAMVEKTDDPQVARVARAFALVEAAGILATRYGVLPWREGAASDAVRTCFAAWRAERGSGRSEEERDALEHLRTFFALHGGARFERIKVIGADDDDPDSMRADQAMVRERCGYRLEEEDGTVAYCVLPEAWRSEIAQDHDPQLLIKVARERGALRMGENGRPQRKRRLPDYPRGTRVYEIVPEKL